MKDVLREMMLLVFGCLSSDNDMEANRLSKCWGLLASHLLFWCQVTPTFDAPSAVLSQACKCNMCQQLHGAHTYIFLLIFGTCTGKDFSSSCCNAACQFGSSANRGTRPLLFPHPFKCSVLARVSTSVLRCKEV